MSRWVFEPFRCLSNNCFASLIICQIKLQDSRNNFCLGWFSFFLLHKSLFSTLEQDQSVFTENTWRDKMVCDFKQNYRPKNSPLGKSYFLFSLQGDKIGGMVSNSADGQTKFTFVEPFVRFNLLLLWWSFVIL